MSKRKSKRERERGGRGGEKAWGKQGRQDQRIRKTWWDCSTAAPANWRQTSVGFCHGSPLLKLEVSNSRHRNKLSWRVQRRTVLIPLDAEALQVPVACYRLLRRNSDGCQSSPSKTQDKQTWDATCLPFHKSWSEPLASNCHCGALWSRMPSAISPQLQLYKEKSQDPMGTLPQLPSSCDGTAALTTIQHNSNEEHGPQCQLFHRDTPIADCMSTK